MGDSIDGAPHLVALVTEPDSDPLETAVVSQVFATAGPVPGLTPPGPGYRLRSVDATDEGALRTVGTAGTVVVPGSAEPFRPRPPALLEALRSAAASGARVVGLCAGAVILAQAGLLDGRTATTHWVHAEEFSVRFPAVRLRAGRLFVADGAFFTSGGGLAAVDLALHLTARDLGRAYANDVARYLVAAPHRAGGQAQFVKDALRAPTATPRLLEWMREHLDEPLSLERMARVEHVSERTLVRWFRREVGTSVAAWVTHERIERAKVLLETTRLPLAQIAAATGFGTAETLRRNFRAHVGIPASAYRTTFAHRDGTVSGGLGGDRGAGGRMRGVSGPLSI